MTDLADHNDDDDEKATMPFKATVSMIVKLGFLKLYQDAETSNGASDLSPSSSWYLPPPVVNDTIDVHSAAVLNHEKKPLQRFNDASIFKVLEDVALVGLVLKLVSSKS